MKHVGSVIPETLPDTASAGHVNHLANITMQQQKVSNGRPRLCAYLGYLSSSLCEVFDLANNLI